MPLIKSAQDITQLGTIMGIWAHPDDETFCSGGILAAATANGQTVVCITATKGEAGVQDENRWPAEKLGEIRAHELEQSCKILGITNHHWLNYQDEACHDVPGEEAVTKIKNLIGQYKPDTVLTFGPEGLTGNPDHAAVSRWVAQAAQGANVNVYQVVEDKDVYNNFLKNPAQKLNWFYNIDQPPLKQREECDLVFELSPELLQKKRAALEAMPSQYDSMFKVLKTDDFEKIFAHECFVKLA